MLIRKDGTVDLGVVVGTVDSEEEAVYWPKGSCLAAADRVHHPGASPILLVRFSQQSSITSPTAFDSRHIPHFQIRFFPLKGIFVSSQQGSHFVMSKLDTHQGDPEELEPCPSTGTDYAGCEEMSGSINGSRQVTYDCDISDTTSLAQEHPDVSMWSFSVPLDEGLNWAKRRTFVGKPHMRGMHTERSAASAWLLRRVRVDGTDEPSRELTGDDAKHCAIREVTKYALRSQYFVCGVL